MHSNKRELRYSIRKLKSGVGAVLIGTILLSGHVVITNTRTVISAEAPRSVTNNNIPSVEQLKGFYHKILELAEADFKKYKTSFENATGQDMKQAFESTNTSNKDLYEKLMDFSSKGLLKDNSGSPLQFSTLNDFKPYLENDYKEALQVHKAKQKEIINKTNASTTLKDKYNGYLDKATTLTNVRKNIPEQFQKALNQQSRSSLQEEIDKAKEKVNQMAYLKMRLPYLKLLDKASSTEEITTHLEAAKKQAEIDKKNHEAVDKIQREINALEHLTSEEKSRYNGILDTSTPDQANKLLTEAKEKNRANYVAKLLALVEELKKQLAEVDKLPELPKTADYAYQTELWTESIRKRLVESLIDVLTVEYFNSKDLKALKNMQVNINDAINYVRIELITRQTALIRKKYPENRSINELFEKHLKQRPETSYATQSGNDLRHYVEDEVVAAYNKIKAISDNLDKKAEAIKKIEDWIAQFSKKPQTEVLIKELEKEKNSIKSIADDVSPIQSLIDTHVNAAKKHIETYEKEYLLYTEALKKGLEDLKKETDRLRALKHNSINNLADNLQKDSETAIKAATLSGEKSYKVTIPETVDKVKKQVDEFIANYHPATPLSPAVKEKIEEEIQEIDYTTEEVANPNLPKGKRQVRTQGQKGTLKITYKVRYQSDTILSRTKFSEVVTKQPVKQIIEVGTKEPQVDNTKPVPSPDDKGHGDTTPNVPQQPDGKGEDSNPTPMPSPEDKDKGGTVPNTPQPDGKGEDSNPTPMPSPEDKGKGDTVPNVPQQPDNKGEDSDSTPQPSPEDKGNGDTTPNVPQQPDNKGEESNPTPMPNPDGKDKGNTMPNTPQPDGKGKDNTPTPQPSPEDKGNGDTAPNMPQPDGKGEDNTPTPQPSPEDKGNSEANPNMPQQPDGKGEDSDSTPQPSPEDKGNGDTTPNVPQQPDNKGEESNPTPQPSPEDKGNSEAKPNVPQQPDGKGEDSNSTPQPSPEDKGNSEAKPNVPQQPDGKGEDSDPTPQQNPGDKGKGETKPNMPQQPDGKGEESNPTPMPNPEDKDKGNTEPNVSQQPDGKGEDSNPTPQPSPDGKDKGDTMPNMPKSENKGKEESKLMPKSNDKAKELLPHTGEENTLMTTITGAAMAVLAVFGIRKKVKK